MSVAAARSRWEHHNKSEGFEKVAAQSEVRASQLEDALQAAAAREARLQRVALAMPGALVEGSFAYITDLEERLKQAEQELNERRRVAYGASAAPSMRTR